MFSIIQYIYYDCKEKQYKLLNYGYWFRGFVVKVRFQKNFFNIIVQVFSGKCKIKYKVNDVYGVLQDKIVKFNELWV